MKRVSLFIATNLAVMLVFGFTLNIILKLTGISFQNTGGLILMSGLFGFGGSIVSLLMSKWMALRQVGGTVIKDPQTPEERWLVDTITDLSEKAEIGMPTVAIYDAEDMNAFATGAKRNDALVAVSTGLLRTMTKEETKAVLAHEISHIKNGDMITLTLLQGVVNTFVIFVSRLIAQVFARNSDGEFSSTRYFMISMVMDLLFGFIASFITRWFSRQREFRADAGAAELVGSQGMIAALERLKAGSTPQLDDSMLAFGITGKYDLSALLMTHPPLEKRIEALRSIPNGVRDSFQAF